MFVHMCDGDVAAYDLFIYFLLIPRRSLHPSECNGLEANIRVSPDRGAGQVRLGSVHISSIRQTNRRSNW